MTAGELRQEHLGRWIVVNGRDGRLDQAHHNHGEVVLMIKPAEKFSPYEILRVKPDTRVTVGQARQLAMDVTP